MPGVYIQALPQCPILHRPLTNLMSDGASIHPMGCTKGVESDCLYVASSRRRQTQNELSVSILPSPVQPAIDSETADLKYLKQDILDIVCQMILEMSKYWKEVEFFKSSL